MLREIAFYGVYLPSLTLVFVLCLGLTWVTDRAMASFDLYQYVWHPAAFRLGLFVCLCAGLALCIYR